MSITRRLNRGAAIRDAKAKLRGQPARIIEYLQVNGGSLTGAIARECAIGNVSDAAAKANRALEPRGFRIVAHLPKPLTQNQFGPSQQHTWTIERV